MSDPSELAELRQRITLLEVQHKVLTAQVQTLREQLTQATVVTQAQKLTVQEQREQMQRQLAEMLAQHFAFDLPGAAMSPDAILAVLRAADVMLLGTEVQQKRILAHVLKGVLGVEAGRNTAGRLWLGMRPKK